MSAVGVLFPWIALGSCIASCIEESIDDGTEPLSHAYAKKKKKEEEEINVKNQ